MAQRAAYIRRPPRGVNGAVSGFAAFGVRLSPACRGTLGPPFDASAAPKARVQPAIRRGQKASPGCGGQISQRGLRRAQPVLAC